MYVDLTLLKDSLEPEDDNVKGKSQKWWRNFEDSYPNNVFI